MNTYAVITGDIVKSRNIKGNDRKRLIKSLKETFLEINSELLHEKKVHFEIFRCDSFQALIKKTHHSLKICFLLRAKIRSLTKGVENQYRDARLSLGIGSVNYNAERIIESDGEAFRYSGIMLDKMKHNERLRIHTHDKEINEELKVECAFADTVVKRWSVKQSEVIYRYLLKNETQYELAKAFNISQPSLRKRLVVSGDIKPIDIFIKRFEKLFKPKI